MDQLTEGCQQKIAQQVRCYVDAAKAPTLRSVAQEHEAFRQPFATPEPEADTASRTT